MRAAIHDSYGPPEQVMRVEDIDRPVPEEGELLVRVRAVSVNWVEAYGVTGTPYFGRPGSGWRRPKSNRIGVDFAGVVEELGPGATGFAVGDEVFGGRGGAFAEYVCVRDGVARKPANVSFEQAAATPVAAVTALQAIRDKADVGPGRRVLVNGASGGVGTYAVQIAKHYGAHVTAVCSTAGTDLMHSLGADRVIDYTREDFTRDEEAGAEPYDVIIDIAGTRSWRACARVLTREGRVVVVGGPHDNRLLGPLGHIVAMRASALLGRKSSTFFIAKLTREVLGAVADLLESGAVRSVIETHYDTLEQLPRALALLRQGHAKGKIVVTL